MPSILDPETMYVDDLPTIWSPVQWDLTEAERMQEIEAQATASLLWAADVPEAILRLLLSETEILRALEPPAGYDTEQQGDWDPSLITYKFRKPVKLTQVVRREDYVYVEYNFGELGVWTFEIEPEKITIERI